MESEAYAKVVKRERETFFWKEINGHLCDWRDCVWTTVVCRREKGTDSGERRERKNGRWWEEHQ